MEHISYTRQQFIDSKVWLLATWPYISFQAIMYGFWYPLLKLRLIA